MYKDIDSPGDMSQVVTIIVGTDKKTYYVHADLLTTTSGYFTACMNPCFAEGQTNVTVLPDVKPRFFGCVVDWLYGGKVEDMIKNATDWATITIRLYQLGDRFMMPKLKNEVIDSFFSLCSLHDSAFHPTCIVEVRKIGLLHSKLGKIFVEIFARDLMQNRTRWQMPPADEPDGKQMKRYESFKKFCGDHESTAEVMRCVAKQTGTAWTHPSSRDRSEFYEDEQF